MNFLIVGPGAMGCLFAARLKLARRQVTLLDHIPERAERINAQGIRVEGVLGDYTVRVPTMIDKIDGPPDVAIICVKANDTRQAATAIKPMIGPTAKVLTLQNGIGNVEVLQEIFGKERTLGGITAEGATLLGDGHIRHAGRGETRFGGQCATGGSLAELVATFNDAGFSTQSVDNINGLIWGKLIVNVGINALTAITRLKNGRLPEVGGTLAVMEDAVREAVEVARAKKIELPYPDPLGRVIEVCRATAANVASMLQDVLKQSITEVAFINGAIVREAEAFGIPTPVNRTLSRLVEAIQETYEERVES